MTVFNPEGATGAFSPSMPAKDLNRPMNSSFVALPRYASGSGVRLAETTRPQGPEHFHPPEKSRPAISWPLSSCGVWQTRHPPRLTRYLPYATLSLAGSGVAIGPATGFGDELDHPADRKIEAARRDDVLDGLEGPHVDDDRRTSSSLIFRKFLVRHHREERDALAVHPFANARIIWPSVQLPRPFSGSGVMFCACTRPGTPSLLSKGSLPVLRCPAWVECRSGRPGAPNGSAGSLRRGW